MPSKEDTGLVHHRGSGRVEVEYTWVWEAADGHAILRCLAIRSAGINRPSKVPVVSETDKTCVPVKVSSQRGLGLLLKMEK